MQMTKRITMIGIKRPGKPWVIRFADKKNKVIGCILPDRKKQINAVKEA